MSEDAYVKIGNLYVIEFSTGVIKVGRTQQKRGHRESEHERIAEAMGISVVRSWSSVTVKQVDTLENILIAYCNKLGTPRRSLEYFDNLDFDQIVEFATDITTPLETKPVSTEIELISTGDECTVTPYTESSSRIGQSMNPETPSKILDSIKRGYNTVSKISIDTGVPERTVRWHLRRFVKQGIVIHEGRRKPYKMRKS